MPRLSKAEYEAYLARAYVHKQRATEAPVPRGTSMREAGLHEAILAFCRNAGFAVVHSRMDRSTSCGVGTPDFVIALPGGRTIWVEAKTGGNKLTMEQAAWMRMLYVLGHHAYVVRSMGDFLDVLKKLHA